MNIEFVEYSKESSNKIFINWLEIEEFYYTSDLKPFIRYEEALKHSETLHNKFIGNIETDDVYMLREEIYNS